MISLHTNEKFRKVEIEIYLELEQVVQVRRFYRKIKSDSNV